MPVIEIPVTRWIESKDMSKEEKKNVVILFAGDSGDGIQLTGSQFTNTAALLGNDISTFPNFLNPSSQEVSNHGDINPE